MASYQLTHDPATVKEIVAENEVHWTPASDPTYVAWLADGNTPDPADPLPIVYAASTGVNETARTTDTAPLEVFRFPCEQLRLYQASLTISGVDSANFVSKIMEGRFTWKRVSGNAVMVGITVVSDIHDAAAAAWVPNAVPSGTDIVFTVQGAAGRTIDWLLVGAVGSYAPAGLEG